MLIILFLKFCGVGVSGLIVDFSITYLFKEKFRVNKYIANSLGFITAATTNYFLNRIWTFQSHDPKITEQYIQFIGIAAIGLGINNFIIYVMTEKMHRKFYFSKLIAILIVTVWNFVMNYFFTFNT